MRSPRIDENARPANRPNEGDRIRFGFKKRAASAGRLADRDCAELEVPVDLATLLETELGSSEGPISMLRVKPLAGRYEFKEQIEELKSMIKPLKEALADRLKREGSLRDALSATQDEINQRLCDFSAKFAQQRRSHEEKLEQAQEIHAKEVQAWKFKELEIQKVHAENLSARECAFAEERRLHEEKLAQAHEKHAKQLEQAHEKHANEMQAWKVKEVEVQRVHAEELSAQLCAFAEHRRLHEQKLEQAQEKHENEAQAWKAKELDAQRVHADKLSAQERAFAEREHQQLLQHEAAITELESHSKEARKELLLELGSVRDQVASATAANAALKAENARLGGEVDALRDEVQEMEQALASEKHCRERESRAKATLLGEHTVMVKTVDLQRQKLEELKNENVTRQAKYAELQQELRVTEGDRERLRETVAEEQAALERQKLVLDSTRAHLDRSQEQLDSVTTEFAKVREEYTQLSEDKRKLELEYCSSKERCQELQIETVTLQEKCAELQQELRGAESDRERLREAVAEEQAALERQKVALDSTRAQLNRSQERLDSVMTELAKFREDCTRLSADKRELELEYHIYKEHNSTSNQAQMEAITELKVTVDKLTQKVDAAQTELVLKSGDVAQHMTSIKRLEQQLANAECSRRELHNTIQELRGNIRVLCRVRPGPPEKPTTLAHIEDNKLTLGHGTESYPFSFDKVFTSSSTQEDIFAEVSSLVQSAMDGYKVSIFAYGQTGSGKTFTMQGGEAPSSWGLIPRSLQQIFTASELMQEKGWKWSLKASFMEVYNEVLRDLLREEGATTTPQCHTIRHDEDWGMMVTNMTCVQVTSMKSISTLMAKAARLRAVGCTDMNSVSSRSHSVFSLYLSGSSAELNTELRGALHLVDLAGSERLDKSGAVGDRLKETQNINRSLSSLADVFLAKAEGRPHIPFRNSKLTHLMEPCLSGHGKTLMAVNVGPEADNSHETLCSLRFASQVSQCTTDGKPRRSAKALVKPASSGAVPPSVAKRRGGA